MSDPTNPGRTRGLLRRLADAVRPDQGASARQANDEARRYGDRLAASAALDELDYQARLAQASEPDSADTGALTHAAWAYASAERRRLGGKTDVELLAEVRAVLGKAGVSPERVDVSTLDDGRVAVVIDEAARAHELDARPDNRTADVDLAYVEAGVEEARREVARTEAQYQRAVRSGDSDAVWTSREEWLAKIDRRTGAEEARRAYKDELEDRELAEAEAVEDDKLLAEAIMTDLDEGLVPDVSSQDLALAGPHLSRPSLEALVVLQAEHVEALEYRIDNVLPNAVDEDQAAIDLDTPDLDREDALYRVANVEQAHNEANVEDAGRDIDGLNEQLRYMPWPTASGERAELRRDLAEAKARYDKAVIVEAEDRETAKDEAAQETRGTFVEVSQEESDAIWADVAAGEWADWDNAEHAAQSRHVQDERDAEVAAELPDEGERLQDQIEAKAAEDQDALDDAHEAALDEEDTRQEEAFDQWVDARERDVNEALDAEALDPTNPRNALGPESDLTRELVEVHGRDEEVAKVQAAIMQREADDNLGARPKGRTAEHDDVLSLYR